MSDDPLEAIKDLQKLHQDDLAILRSLVEAPATITIPRTRYDALMAAANALAHFVAIQSTYTNTPLQAEAIMRAVQSLRALRAAGIQTEET